jgi:tetratricopeptide (TPR) repeat protein
VLPAIALVLMAVGSTQAQQPDDATKRAKALFDEAQTHFSLGEFKKALSLYKEAYRVKRLPAFLFNIGQCHRNLKQCDKALFFFKQYLAQATEVPNRADVEKLIKICEAQLKEEKSEVEPKPEPDKGSAGAGSAAPSTPKQDDDKGGAGDAAPSTPEQGSAGAGGAAPSTPKRPRKKLRPLWFWTAAAASAALLVTGTVTGVMALQQSDEYKDPDTSVDRRLDLRDSGKTLRNVSTATMAIGGVAAAASAVLYFFTDWNGESEVAAGVSPGGCVMLSGRF